MLKNDPGLRSDGALDACRILYFYPPPCLSFLHIFLSRCLSCSGKSFSGFFEVLLGARILSWYSQTSSEFSLIRVKHICVYKDEIIVKSGVSLRF
jgi:hypothetical protein